MKILLDTHILLWWLEDSLHLPRQARSLIMDSSNDIFVSAASLWEIAIKVSSGKLSVDLDVLKVKVLETGFVPLPITASHALEIGCLPKHHADPFDRMLIVQAKVEPMHLLTHDTKLKLYGEMVMLV
jgi:PIN domain nuclease of toxin-antitoxin system